MKNKADLVRNSTYQITIEKLGKKGEGIGYIDDLPIMVRGTLPGEEIELKIIKIENSFAVGKCLSIIKKAPVRVDSKCEYSGRCGGCQMLHIDYQEQLKIKEAKIKEAFSAIKKLKTKKIKPIIPSENIFNYRNKAQFAVGQSGRNVLVGLFTIGTHNIVDTTACLVQHPKATELLKIFRDYLAEVRPSIYDEKTRRGLVRHVLIKTAFSTGQSMLTIVINGKELPKWANLKRKVKEVSGCVSLSININTDPGDTVLGARTITLWGKESIEETLAGTNFQITPNSFFQVNPTQTTKLAEFAQGYLDIKGDEVVWDAYCGIGLFSLLIAPKVNKVIGVEVNPEAIVYAKRNAKANKTTNIEFIAGLAEDLFPDLAKKAKPDIVIMDPPRKGCDLKFLGAVITAAPKKIIYVSCNPETLARDLEVLINDGYKLVETQPLDMFPHTMHVETICFLKKG
jgi:23S rRNA (uracil1939-C5)-methyltransferase